MNKDRRKELEQVSEELGNIVSALTTQKGELERLKETLEGIKADEQEYFDNMPESFQQAEKGQAAETAISEMDEAISSIESAIDNITNAGA